MVVELLAQPLRITNRVHWEDSRCTAFFGLALALFLLFSLGFFYWAPLVSPLWVIMISVYNLLVNYRRSKGENGTAPTVG